jgi:hypothetical protein
MTTAARNAASPLDAPHRAAAIPAAVRPRLSLRWSISPHAAARAGLVSSASAVTLEIDVVESAPLVVRIVVSGHERAIACDSIAAPQFAVDAHGIHHAEVPGVLSVTWIETAADVRVLYVRTTILAALGLEGGRYEFAGSA